MDALFSNLLTVFTVIILKKLDSGSIITAKHMSVIFWKKTYSPFNRWSGKDYVTPYKYLKEFRVFFLEHLQKNQTSVADGFRKPQDENKWTRFN